MKNLITITKAKDYLSSQEKQDKVKDLEKEIDELIYKLYGLSKEEIKIVENVWSRILRIIELTELLKVDVQPKV